MTPQSFAAASIAYGKFMYRGGGIGVIHFRRIVSGYESFGFVVFKFRQGHRARAHPMAFSFPTQNPEMLFFPTVHIHDGVIHEMADFDHILYTQNEPRPSPTPAWPGTFWMPSGQTARKFLRVSQTRDLVDVDLPCFQSLLTRTWKNEDLLVPI